jgi:PKD repeat protein
MISMRSIGLLAVVTGTLVLAAACGDGAGTPPPDNTAPEADFDLPSCIVNVPCTFVSTSTDDDQVTSWSWDLDGVEGGTPNANTPTASFTYSTAGDVNVGLTVRDAGGLSSTFTTTITVAPANAPPTAGFTHTCTLADCSFTSTSADVAPGTITTYAWTFGDGGTADVSNPSHSYAATAPTDFTVTLTVTDNGGATDVETQTITVTPVNTPPTAGFTYSCNATVCSFTSTSTDLAPGTIATYAWTFGDGGHAEVSNPLHSYAVTAPRDFTVSLTVTDNEGATDVETQTVSVAPAPPTAEGCTTSGSHVDCALNITARSTIKLKLLGLSCGELNGERVTIPQPIGDQSFLNVCARTVGDSTRIFGGPTDTAIVFEPGSQATIRFTQGTPGRGAPAPGSPAAQLTGTFPNWTINFEDGANPGAADEPDFADVVLGVEAIPRN